MAVGDVDKDGIPEIVIANYNHANQIVKYNENIGDFVAQDLIPGETMATRGVAIGDIDNDGNYEIVFANYNQVNQILKYNNDADRFEATPLRPSERKLNTAVVR